MTPPTDTVGARYASTRLRLTALLESMDEAGWERPAAACPGWRVRDVLAHLVGIIEDAVAGRLSGPPPPALTAEAVARHLDDDPRDLLASWAVGGPLFEAAITERGVWPAFIDVLSHEHDVRGALGLPGERTGDDVRFAGRLLTAELPPGLVVHVDEPVGTEPVADGEARLVTTSWELLRVRLGRRSRAQVLLLDWVGDPEPFLDDLFVFGPAARDLVE
ncbi:maleylpyruvate isomerase family mycothiol-dependent enzyme [Aquihabitans sp. McL0605]|uniref:maleylpyruvate isomerase family mycothiol-dependent enzyme n=1 Tax=Aquihabitans sp. McL0605 TaxID=3415671 RepID=UPI003CF62DFE